MAFFDFARGAIFSLIGDYSGNIVSGIADRVPFNELDVSYKEELVLAFSAGIAFSLPIPFKLRVAVQLGLFIVFTSYLDSTNTFYEMAEDIVLDSLAIILLITILVDESNDYKEIFVGFIVGIYYYVKKKY